MSISEYEFEAYLEGLLSENEEPENYDPEWNARVMEYPPQAISPPVSEVIGLAKDLPF